jgi:hypothetical protein
LYRIFVDAIVCLTLTLAAFLSAPSIWSRLPRATRLAMEPPAEGRLTHVAAHLALSLPLTAAPAIVP